MPSFPEPAKHMDIALMELTDSIPFGQSEVCIINLAPTDFSYKNRQFRISGFGAENDENDKQKQILKAILVDTFDDTICNTTIKRVKNSILVKEVFCYMSNKSEEHIGVADVGGKCFV